MISFIGSTRIHSPQFTVCEGGMKPVERQVALSACLPFRSTPTELCSYVQKAA